MPAKKIETNEKCNYRNGTIIQDISLSLRCTICQIQIYVYYIVLFPYIFTNNTSRRKLHEEYFTFKM